MRNENKVFISIAEMQLIFAEGKYNANRAQNTILSLIGQNLLNSFFFYAEMQLILDYFIQR